MRSGASRQPSRPRSRSWLPLLLRSRVPEGLSAETYGRRIGATAVEPHRPVDELHLFHLLQDDLPFLHELLRGGVHCVGRWRARQASGAPARIHDAARVGALAARCELAEAFWAAWRVGRGRPVDGDVLRRADGVTDRFLEPLAALAAARDHDARRLVAEIELPRDQRDERLKGYRESQATALRAWLLDEGYLDPDDPLDEAGVLDRVFPAVAGHVDAGRITSEQVRTQVHRLFALART